MGPTAVWQHLGPEHVAKLNSVVGRAHECSGQARAGSSRIRAMLVRRGATIVPLASLQEA